MKRQIPMSNNEAGRRIQAFNRALAERLDLIWLHHCHRRDLALFVGVEPDFETWRKSVDKAGKAE